MTTETELEIFEKNVNAIFEDMSALLVSKRRSYGPSNLLEDGGYGILIRDSDKTGRLRTMYKSGTYANDDGDSMMDAWRDKLGYATLAILYEMEQSVKRDRERIENPPPGESYVTINLPDPPTPGPFSMVEFEGSVDFITAETDEGVSYLIGNPKPEVVAPSVNQQAWPSDHNPKAVNKGSTIEEMLSWDETGDWRKSGSFTMHECCMCGRRSYLAENLPYDCQPFIATITVQGAKV